MVVSQLWSFKDCITSCPGLCDKLGSLWAPASNSYTAASLTLLLGLQMWSPCLTWGRFLILGRLFLTLGRHVCWLVKCCWPPSTVPGKDPPFESIRKTNLQVWTYWFCAGNLYSFEYLQSQFQELSHSEFDHLAQKDLNCFNYSDYHCSLVQSTF